VSALRAAVAFAALGLLAACERPEAPADPYAPERPTTEEVGVPAPPVDSEGWFRLHYADRVTLFAALGPIPGGVAFVGDSLTDGMRWSEAFPTRRVRNFGINGDTVQGVVNRIDQVIAAEPAQVFVLIGTNDITHGRTTEEIAASYATLLDRIREGLPEARIYAQSVLPREPTRDAAVRDLNLRIAVLARERGVEFVDIHSRFVVGGGRLDPRVTLDDLHLTGEGYMRWRDAIAPLIEPETRR
jgi:lysophospholipase L1-like esterase